VSSEGRKPIKSLYIFPRQD